MVSGQAAADLSALVRAACGGSEEAFRLLYREVQPGLLRYLRGLVGGVDAEDLASQTWAQIARDLRSFRDEGAGFRGWAAAIARRRALDHLRRTPRRASAGVTAGVLTGLPHSDDTAERAATQEAIAFVATLSRDQAEAVLLRVVMGLDTAAVARVMGKRPGAVRTALWRGLRKLGERLEQARGREVAAAGVTRPGDSTPGKTR